ncbi:MAG TPA: ATP synthase F1 subunit epsilon [Candidatus Eremiobacteraceae bacterium]|nr:ATP synthase F1 subunit epsilon [Candidatus Eremiobacteraceae bacterium]
MAASVDLDVITPGAVKFQGKVEIVVAPGGAGDLAALPNHAPMLTTLRIGVLRATVADGEKRRIEFAVNGGFMQITPAKCVVLTDMALSAADINIDAVQAEARRAAESLAQKHGANDVSERDAVAWAAAQLEVARAPQV